VTTGNPGIWVRECRGRGIGYPQPHYHVTCAAGDLIFGPYATRDEAQEKADELNQSYTNDRS
jgi:hypothetical protein